MNDEKISNAIIQLTEVFRTLLPSLITAQNQVVTQNKEKEDNKMVETTASSTQNEAKDTIEPTKAGADRKGGDQSGIDTGHMTSSMLMSAVTPYIKDAIDASGFTNILHRQATDIFEGSTKELAAKNVQLYARAGVTPDAGEMDNLMSIARVENRINKDALNYMDVTSWSNQWERTKDFFSSSWERYGFR
jgi:predicted phage tail protein